jgi:hypothetical protein
MFQYQESLLILTAEGGNFFVRQLMCAHCLSEGGIPPPLKKLFGFGQIPKVALAEAGGSGPLDPRPATPLYRLRNI